MIVSDLNYLEAAEQNVEGAFGYYSYYQNDKVKLQIKTYVDLDDNSAESFADAGAFGSRTFAKTQTFTETDSHYSVASSASFSATDDFFS